MRKITTKYDYPLVELQWTDAETDHGWEQDTATDHELPVVTTVGFLIKQTVDSQGHGVYVLASTIGGGSCNSRIKIPQGMVVEEKFLYQPKSYKSLNKKVVDEITSL